MVCGKCKAQIETDDKFCPKCGADAQSFLNPDKDIKAIISLIFGIISLVLPLIIPSIIGIILGRIGLKSTKRGLAIAGLITSALGIVLLITLALMLILSSGGETANTLNGTTWVYRVDSKEFIGLMKQQGPGLAEISDADIKVFLEEGLGITKSDFPLEISKIDFTSKIEFTMYTKMEDPKDAWIAVGGGTFAIDGDTLILTTDGDTTKGTFNKKGLTIEIAGMSMVFKKKK